MNEIASVYGKPAWRVALERVKAIAGKAGGAGKSAVVAAPATIKSVAGVTAQGVVELAEIAKDRVKARNLAAAAG